MNDWMFSADHGQLTFRWAHVLAGVVWIGMLYFFNWVNGPFVATLDGDTKRRVIPELMPRALYWFRWGAAWTWFTGVVLLFVMYYVGEKGLFFGAGENAGMKPTPAQWGVPFVALFVGFALYDNLFKLLGVKSDAAHSASVVIWGLVAVAFHWLATGALGMSYRAGFIHVGALFGTSMAANVWMRIWPAQKRIIAAVKEGQAPDPGDAALAGKRSKHNTYMSVALLLLMVSVDQGRFGQTGGGAAQSALALALVLGASWVVTFLCYKKAAGVSGF